MRSAIIPAHFVRRYAGLVRWFGRGGRVLKALGPYAAIELLLPGGSLLALLLWFARRRRAQAERRAGECWTASDTAFAPRRNEILGPAIARAAP